MFVLRIFNGKMSEILNTYTKAIDTSDFDEKHVYNDIKVLINEHKEKLEAANDAEGLKLFKLLQSQ